MKFTVEILYTSTALYEIEADTAREAYELMTDHGTLDSTPVVALDYLEPEYVVYSGDEEVYRK